MLIVGIEQLVACWQVAPPQPRMFLGGVIASHARMFLWIDVDRILGVSVIELTTQAESNSILRVLGWAGV